MRHRVLDPSVGSVECTGLCALGIMTKAPRPGLVKTRLVPALTPAEAAALNICFLRDISASILRSTETTQRAVGVGIYTPVGAEDSYTNILPENFLLIPQRGHDFGERLRFAIEDLLKVGFAAVCLINSDSPTVSPDFFTQATAALAQEGDRVVLGPSDDGGYYLIGLKRLHAHLFEQIEWSTEKVLQQTTERARELKLDAHFLPATFDVDDRATLQRLYHELLRENGSAAAPATAAFMRSLGRDRLA